MKNQFSKEDFFAALNLLDQRVGASKQLQPYTPIRLISGGGFIAVTHLGNHDMTEDLDYFADPDLGEGLQVALKEEIARVSESLQFVTTWCNDGMAIFLQLLDNPRELFERSVEQGQEMFAGRYLKVYAVLWIWGLVRKLKRLQMEVTAPRIEDLSDCVNLAHILFRQSGPIDRQMLQQFDHTDQEPPVFRDTVEVVGNTTLDCWGVFPFDLNGLPAA